MLCRCGRRSVRVKSVDVVRVRAAVEVTGRASMVLRMARAIDWVRLEVSIMTAGASVCAVLSKRWTGIGPATRNVLWVSSLCRNGVQQILGGDLTGSRKML